MKSADDPISLFHLEVMRLRDGDAEMLQQVERKQGVELVAFVSDWWSTRSRQILMEMTEAGQFDKCGYEKIWAHLKKQEQVSWRNIPDVWRRQFGVGIEVCGFE